MADSITFCLAGEEHLPAVKELFNRCFDSPAEADYVLGQQDYARVYLALCDGIPAAMLVAFPGAVRTGEKSVLAAYLYGVATHPDYRRRGLCTALMEYVHGRLRDEGYAFTLLYPSSPENRAFYTARGYRGVSSLCRGHFINAASVGDVLPASRTDAEGYELARSSFCRGSDYFAWGGKGIAFQEGWLQLFSGGFYLLGSPANPQGCAAVTREGNEYFVRELLIPPERLTQALSALCRELNAPEIGYSLEKRLGICASLVPEPFAMAFDLQPADRRRLSEIYFNLAMD